MRVVIPALDVRSAIVRRARVTRQRTELHRRVETLGSDRGIVRLPLVQPRHLPQAKANEERRRADGERAEERRASGHDEM